MGGGELMGVFDGGTHRVSVLMRDGEETDHYPDDVSAFVDSLRDRPDVKAVETRWVHYVLGEVDGLQSFGNFWTDEDEEDDEG
ncbi:hypothetical protein [Streptomyces sp. NPDC006638]|uniref:hypothetical protein n=1 Tax=Streptomyces sp. NPDC006638 TaxID=3157183 RepID=UPI0033B795AB